MAFVGGARRRPGALVAFGVALLLACSPEAVRTRDGGPGADPQNYPRQTVQAPAANPQPADTSLWPGKAVAPVDRLSRGDTLPHS
jgi:hypothetical protein